MKFHTTLRIPKTEVSVSDADNISEAIREQGYPGGLDQAWSREGNDLVWHCEFEGESLSEIARRYEDTREQVSGMTRYGYGSEITWTADPDDPIEVATRAARDVLEWEKHFDGIELPDKLRESLEAVAGEDWKP